MTAHALDLAGTAGVDMSDPATKEDLKLALDAVNTRIGDLRQDMHETIGALRKSIDKLSDGNPQTERCMQLLERLGKVALQPSTLILLIVLTALVMGGSPAAFWLIQHFPLSVGTSPPVQP